MASPAVRSAAAAGLFVLLVSLVSGAADAPAGGPRTAVDRFYAVCLRHDENGGLPDDALLAKLAPLMSHRLHGLIVEAKAYQADSIRRHPHEPSPDGGPPVIDKPPFVDGDLFSSLFEGPKSYRVGRAVREGEGWRVQIRFRYDDSRWDDAVIVRKEDGRFVIDDVVYGGAGEFNPAGRLSDALSAAMKEPD